VNTGDATAADFCEFLKFLRLSGIGTLEVERGLAFLSFCRLLGNDALALVLLTLLHPIRSGGEISVGWPMATVVPPRLFCEADLDFCASRFYLYSAKEIQMLDRSLLHRILESPSLTLRTEDAFLRLLLDLGDDFADLLNYVEVSYLSEAGIALFVDRVQFADLTATLWSKVVNRLKGANRPEVASRRFQRSESAILTAQPSVLSQFQDKKLKLIYRGSDDGFGASDFHSKCDGIGNTVTVILTTKGWIFGGFSPLTWSLNGGYQADSTKQSFLFQIKDARNSAPRKFPISNPTYAIYCQSSYGPTFGGAHDVYVSDCCDQNGNSYTNLGHSYANDTGITGTQVFTGEQYFTVKEIEVFSIT
jgi:hypothetical protein